MKNLLRIEWVKTWNYTGFKVIIVLHALLFLLVAFVISQVDITVPGFSVKKIYQFPNVWSTFSWLANRYRADLFYPDRDVIFLHKTADTREANSL